MVFDKLAAAATLSATARALGITHVTVARRLARLEALSLELARARGEVRRI